MGLVFAVCSLFFSKSLSRRRSPARHSLPDGLGAGATRPSPSLSGARWLRQRVAPAAPMPAKPIKIARFSNWGRPFLCNTRGGFSSSPFFGRLSNSPHGIAFHPTAAIQRKHARLLVVIAIVFRGAVNAPRASGPVWRKVTRRGIAGHGAARKSHEKGTRRSQQQHLSGDVVPIYRPRGQRGQRPAARIGRYQRSKKKLTKRQQRAFTWVAHPRAPQGVEWTFGALLCGVANQEKKRERKKDGLPWVPFVDVRSDVGAMPTARLFFRFD